MATFEIKVTSPTQPGVINVQGGSISTIDNGDGTWTLSSNSNITTFQMDTNKADITKIEIISSSSITSLYNTFNGCTNMTDFVASATDFGNCTNFGSAWYGCSGLTSFPTLDTSSGTDFRGTWDSCSGLTSFPTLDTSSGTDFRGTWDSCSGLTFIPYFRYLKWY